MFFARRKSQTIIAIDIGSYAIKTIVSRQLGKTVCVEKITYHPIPKHLQSQIKQNEQVDNHQLAHFVSITVQPIIQSVYKSSNKRQCTVVLSIPTADVMLKMITLDTGLTDEEIEAEVHLSLIDFVHYPIEEVYLDFVKVDDKQHNQRNQSEQVLVAACHRDVVDRLIAPLEVTYKENVIVDIQSFVIGQVVEKFVESVGEKTVEQDILHSHNNPQNLSVVLDIGHYSSRLYSFQQGQLAFYREISCGGYNLTEDIMTYLGVDEERAEGIKHSLKNREPDTIIDAAMHNYCNNFITQLLPHLIELSASTTHNGSIVTVYLIGGGSIVADLRENLETQLSGYGFSSLSYVYDYLPIESNESSLCADNISHYVVGLGLTMRNYQ